MQKKFTVRNLLQLSKEQTLTLTCGFTALFFGSLITLLFPWLVRSLLNGSYGIDIFNYLPQAGAFFVVLFAVQSICFFFRHYCFTVAGLRIVASLRNKLFNNLAYQKASFFDEQRTGDLLSRLSNDCQLMQRAATTSLSVAIRYSLQVIVGLIAMFFISVKLSLILCCSIPLFAISGMMFSKKLRKLSKDAQSKLGDAGVIAEETITNFRSVKIFSAEPAQASSYKSTIQDCLSIGEKRTVIAAAFSSGMVFIMHSTLMGVAGYGAYLVNAGSLSMGDLTGFVLYGVIVAVSFGFLTSIWEEFAQALAAGERVFELIDSEPELSGDTSPGNSDYAVEFDSVSFAYASAPNKSVLSNVSFKVKPGENIALVGISGGGKSTIAALIPSFYQPTGGSVKVFGICTSKIELTKLRDRIAVVTQEPEVFSTNIRENILIADPTLTDDRIKEVLSQAQLSEFLNNLEDGLDTWVGDKGIRLSGGQKQRLAIARAMAKNPSLLILDEATSSLDAENEALVQIALEKLMSNRTTITIAHRLSTVKSADSVLVVKNGEIIQAGKHDELVNQDGIYKDLVSLQLLDSVA